MSEESEYLRILRLYGQVVNKLAGSEVDDQRLLGAHSLALKLFEHGAAVYSLAQGVETEPLVGEAGLLAPYSSLAVLARAMLEDYLLFFYVFMDPETEDKFEFRYCAWRLRGLLVRERFVTDFPPEDKGSTEEQIEFLKKQLKIHDDLRERIRKTDRFRKLKSKRQQRILKEGKWLFPPWVEIAQSAGIGQRFAQATYALLSDQGHSGGLSAMQMASLSIEERVERIQSTLDFAKSIVARMMFSYIDKFPATTTVLESNPEIARLSAVYAGALSIVK